MRRLEADPSGSGSLHDALSGRIFVSIASYRDPELPLTLASALERAERPDRLRFGVCNQYDDEARTELDQFADDARFRIDAVSHKRSKGVGWARHRVARLFADEEYVLQIDSHTRFAGSWDTRLIEMLDSIDDLKPLLTTYPPGYHKLPSGRDELEHVSGIQRVRLTHVNPDLTTVQENEPVIGATAPGKTGFLAAGLIFARGSFLRDVPVDPGIYFLGEEISVALRAYTHGYNLYFPHENLIWHYYDRPGPKNWTDHRSWSYRNARSLVRLHDLLVGDAGRLDPYGLGTIRSRADYERYASVDFAVGSNPFQQRGGGYQKGEEVLIDCLILARCNDLLRCLSAVAEYAMYFNETLEAINLNHAHEVS